MTGPPLEVERLIDALPDGFALASTGKGRCIEGSLVIVTACRRLGIKADPMACDVFAANAVAVPLLGTPPAQQPDDAFTVGILIDGEPPDGSTRNLTEPYRRGHDYWGHVVVVGDDWFVDATAAQLSRPARGITINGALGGPYDPAVDHVTAELPDGALIQWCWRPEVRSYRNTPAWRQDIPRELTELLCAAARGAT